MFDSLKKAAGSILFEDTGDKSTPAQTPQKPSIGFINQGTSTASAISTGPSINQEMVEELRKVITRRASAFTTLEERSNAMASAIPDEIVRTKAAFGILSSEGRTAAQIIQAIDLHVMDLESEGKRFAASSKDLINKKVGGLRTEIDNLNAAINSDNSLIQKLQEQIAQAQQNITANQQVIAGKSDQADSEEANITKKVNDFNSAVDFVKQSLINRKSTLASALA